jgi:hypothetical protein
MLDDGADDVEKPGPPSKSRSAQMSFIALAAWPC